MKIFQKEITLEAKRRGFHLVTSEVMEQFPEISEIETGMFTAFIKHTSASLSINENADPTVRHDFEEHMKRMVPEGQAYYKHTMEGPDDMPAHIKASLMGFSIQIPVTRGKLNMGTWQGIYLCEHRDHGGRRKLILSVIGN